MNSQAPWQARLPRGSLNAETIARTSLRLLDEGGSAQFSMPRLGRALGADPTAVYRHFANKDDLLLAVADLLLEEVSDGFQPSGCWRNDLAELARRIRRVYTTHPAAGALAAPRVTRRPAEMRVADAIHAAIQAAGFEGHDAALLYRVFADFALFWAGSVASLLALDPAARAGDESSWAREYLAVDSAKYPHTWRVREELAQVGGDEVFESALDLLLFGLAAQAPLPCGCPEHTGPQSARATTGRQAKSV